MELETKTLEKEENEIPNLEKELSSESPTSEDNGILQKLKKVYNATDYYFRPKSFEKNGKIYEKMGIRTFKKFLPFGDYTNRLIRKFAPKHRLVDSSEKSLNHPNLL